MRRRLREWQTGAPILVRRVLRGFNGWLAVSYYRSPQFQGLRDSTKQTYRRIIETFREKHGKRLVRDLRREHLKILLGNMADRPQAANRLLSLLKIMLDHALDNGWIAINRLSVFAASKRRLTASTLGPKPKFQPMKRDTRKAAKRALPSICFSIPRNAAAM